MTKVCAEIIMYSSPFCGYCAAAKRLLTDKGAQYTDIDVFAEAGARDAMVTASGRTTVPQIFINDRHIGGFDELKALDDAGELDSLLSQSNNTTES